MLNDLVKLRGNGAIKNLLAAAPFSKGKRDVFKSRCLHNLKVENGGKA